MEYIDIKNPYECCGCRACADACHKSCIEMVEDVEGFVYPKINTDLCVKCGKCKSVCPILHDNKNMSNDQVAYAYVSANNETVMRSSSGGGFSLIMDGVAAAFSDYVIIGAAFDGIEVKHRFATDRASSEIFKKSKYIQSNTSGIYKIAKEYLMQNKTVLFSGTPCQVAALKNFLGRDYKNLITVDIVCHGVPNQNCFLEYVSDMEKRYKEKITAIEFRNKRDFDGIKPNPRTIKLTFDNGYCMDLDIQESEFLYAYYTGLIYRPSCETCKFACSNRPGDITLGDYWGIEKVHPELNSLRGVSLVRFNTEKGKLFIDSFKKNGIFIETEWSFACAENHQLSFPAKPHRNRNKFFRLRSRGVAFCDNVNICKKPDNIFQKISRKINLAFKHDK